MSEQTAVTTQQTTELTAGEKFSNHVLREFGSQVAGEVGATDYQRQLIQGYFIGIDRALKSADESRLAKNAKINDKKYNNDVPVIWNNINLQSLALDVVYYAKMGLDMIQPNHLTAIPFKNKKTGKYDITFIKGYNGIQYIAEKYALDKPKAITTELVYATDIFKPIKKNINSDIESYEFEITDPFNRGEIRGGFGYIEFSDPTKNKLIIMTLKDILKRKPKYAAAEFWGGKTTEWQNGKQVEVETDGWYDEMCMKTLKREVYSMKNIQIDPKKIDDSFQHMKMMEMKYVEMEVQAAIEENANSEEFDIPDEIVDSRVVEEPQPDPVEEKKPSTPKNVKPTNPEEPDWMPR